MNLSGPLLPRQRTTKRDERWRPVLLAILTVAAVVIQFLLHGRVYLRFVELPLLLTLHFAVSRRSPARSLLYGAAVGLMQDALSDRPLLGVYGIVKTLIGFFAASAGLRMAADSAATRIVVTFLFYLLHQGFHLVLTSALLGEHTDVHLVQLAGEAAFNAAVAVPLFQLLDRL